MAAENHIWNRPEWREEAHGWIQGELERQDIQIAGDIEEIHQLPWSIVLRVPCGNEDLFFKASAIRPPHEPALTRLLSSVSPASVPQLIAIDQPRGWMLMRDGGSRLRETLKAEPDLYHWEQLLPEYSRLQIAVSTRLDEVLQAGVPDRRLQNLPVLYTQLIAQEDLFRIDLDDGISSQEYQRLLDLQHWFAETCGQLASFGIPDSVHHGDLHDGNVFYQDSRYVFFDWGDCSVSHPFFSLRTSYVSVENTLKIEENAPEFDLLRDAYLTAWHDYQPEEKLVKAFGLAQQLWSFSSALIWHHAISSLPTAQQKDYAYIIPALAEEFLEGIKS